MIKRNSKSLKATA